MIYSLHVDFQIIYIIINDGRIRYKGKPEEVITKDNMREIYDVECEVINRGSNQILIQYT